jgi:hypothetical protein
MAELVYRDQIGNAWVVGEGKDSVAAGGSAVKRAGVKGNAEQSKAKSGEMEDFLGLPRGLQK